MSRSPTSTSRADCLPGKIKPWRNRANSIEIQAQFFNATLRCLESFEKNPSQLKYEIKKKKKGKKCLFSCQMQDPFLATNIGITILACCCTICAVFFEAPIAGLLHTCTNRINTRPACDKKLRSGSGLNASDQAPPGSGQRRGNHNIHVRIYCINMCLILAVRISRGPTHHLFQASASSHRNAWASLPILLIFFVKP